MPGYKPKSEKQIENGRRSAAIRKAKAWGLELKRDIVILDFGLIVKVGQSAIGLTEEDRKLCAEYSHGEMIRHNVMAMSSLVKMKLPNPGVVWPGEVVPEEKKAELDSILRKLPPVGVAPGGVEPEEPEPQDELVVGRADNPSEHMVAPSADRTRIPEEEAADDIAAAGAVLGSDNIMGPDPNPEILSMVALGFTPEQAIEALDKRGNDGPTTPLIKKKEPLPPNTPPSVTKNPETEVAELVELEGMTLKFKHWKWIKAAVDNGQGLFTFQDCIDKIVAKAFASDGYRGVKTQDSFSGKREDIGGWM